MAPESAKESGHESILRMASDLDARIDKCS